MPDIDQLRGALAYVKAHGFGDNVDADSIIEEAAQELLDRPPMVVAFYIGHNDGTETGVLTKPGDAEAVVDLYEADGRIRAFSTEADARSWLTQQAEPNEDDFLDGDDG